MTGHACRILFYAHVTFSEQRCRLCYVSCLQKNTSFNTCLAHPVELHRACSSPDIVMSKPISPEPAGPSSDCLLHVPSPPPSTRYTVQPDLHFDSSPSTPSKGCSPETLTLAHHWLHCVFFFLLPESLLFLVSCLCNDAESYH